MKPDLSRTTSAYSDVHISTSIYILNNYLYPQITLYSYKQLFIQPFTPTISRNSTLEVMSLYVQYYGTNKILPQRRITLC